MLGRARCVPRGAVTVLLVEFILSAVSPEGLEEYWGFGTLVGTLDANRMDPCGLRQSKDHVGVIALALAAAILPAHLVQGNRHDRKRNFAEGGALGPEFKQA